MVWALWIVSEVAAMATDLAEFLGGAIGLSLLLHIPLIAGMGVTAVLTYGILMFEGRGFRPIEIIIGALGRRDRALLSRRNVHRAGRLGRGGDRQPSFPDCRTPAR